MCYSIAGLSAILSSLCYSEYAVEFPVAGGSFTFILHTFGEFWAWITATNLLFNYSAPSVESEHFHAVKLYTDTGHIMITHQHCTHDLRMVTVEA